MFHQQTMFCITNHHNIVIGLRVHLIQILLSVRMQENIVIAGLMRVGVIQNRALMLNYLS
jgi:hypothetical protein